MLHFFPKNNTGAIKFFHLYIIFSEKNSNPLKSIRKLKIYNIGRKEVNHMATKKELLNLNEKLQATLCEVKAKIDEALRETELICPLPDETGESPEAETLSSEKAKEESSSETEKDNDKA